MHSCIINARDARTFQGPISENSSTKRGAVKGKWQQKFLSAYLKETPKQYIEVYYRIFISALFGEIF